jgi:GTP-binding protein
LQVNLKFIADVGLIGFPNAGKSSLLNFLTNANSKVGNYKFTTLDPHLGVLQEFVIADIPGIIEGASEGKGLGVKFLKHIKRTKMIAHLVSFEQEDMIQAYKNIRKELESYDDELAKKQEVIILTKTDMATPEGIEQTVKEFKKINKNTFTMSAFDDVSVKKVSDELVKILRK